MTRPDPSPRWLLAATAALLGCASQVSPHRRVDPPGEVAQPSEGDPMTVGTTHPDERRLDARPHDGSEDPPDMTVRVDFSVDPANEFRGGIRMPEQVSWHLPNGRLRFIPTRKIIEELRERWRERARRR